MNGKLIVLEGLDGSGKATQTSLLYEALQAQGYKVRKVSFPNYDSPACAPVKMYLHGEFGSKAEDVNAYAASMLYAVDRFAAYKTDWQSFYQEGGIVLADRYTTSNAVHQCAKLPPEQWDAYLSWLFDFEYNKVAIPAPDAVVYLHVDPVVSQRLIKERYHGDESKKDIHEKDMHHLQCAQQAAAYCAEKLGWHRLECVQQDSMRPVQEIHAQVLRIVLNCLCGA